MKQSNNSVPEERQHIVRLVLYACSILRSGIAIGPVSGRSNDELLRALSVTLDAALPETVEEGEGAGPDDGDSLGCWAVSDKAPDSVTTVQIPDPAVDLSDGGIGVGLEDCCKEAHRQNLDVTAKFFYLMPPSSTAASSETTRFDPQWPNEAMEELERATGLDSVDTMIVSFPGLSYNDKPSTGCDSELLAAASSASDEEVLNVWKGVSANQRLRSLGVSDFSKSRLERIYPSLAPRSPPTSERPQANGDANVAAPSASSSLRRPRVNQINTTNEVPDDLRKLAKSEGLQLFTHSDCSDILPPKTFALLLNKYAHRLPPPLVEAMAKASTPSAEGDSGQRDVRLQPKWVLKYTVVIKDRGVVADKGYIVNVSSV